MKKLIALLLALVMVIGLAACGKQDTATPTVADVAITTAAADPTPAAETEAAGNTTDLPRDETLYFAGQQWGTVNSWNIIGTNQNNAMAIAAGAGYRTTMFETLYMWNVMTGELIGLLATTPGTTT
jgi:peptide/nickel transport system substrate-binding protein